MIPYKVGDKLIVLQNKPECADVWSGDEVEVTLVVQANNMNNGYFLYTDKSGQDWSSANPNFFQLADKVCPLKKGITTLPLDSTARKEFPIYSGPLKYFPKAIAEVARVCKIGNDKHNPGEALHHARGKSNDHADCIMRHLIDMSEDFGKGVGKDENGIPQVAYVAWRALALAQEWYEKNGDAPLAPGAKV